MALCENYDVEDPLRIAPEDTGSNGPYVFDANQNSVAVGRFPTMIDEVPGGEEFIGRGVASADYCHYAFGTNNVEFAPGGLTSAPGSAYDNDVAANTATVISKLPGGANIPQDPQGCNNENGKQRQCKDEFVRIQAVSTDGSNILMSTWAKPTGEFPDKNEETGVSDTFIRRDLHLYMHTPALNYDITEGHGAHFVGMDRDGSTGLLHLRRTADRGRHRQQRRPLHVGRGDGRSHPALDRGPAEPGNTDDCTVDLGRKMRRSDASTRPSTASTPEKKKSIRRTTGTRRTAKSTSTRRSSSMAARARANQRNLYVYPQRRAAVRHHADRPRARRTGCRSRRTAPTWRSSPRRRRSPATKTRAPGRCTSTNREAGTANGHDLRLLRPDRRPARRRRDRRPNGLFMSDDGRTFFSTKAALVPFDTNGKIDVYEYTEGRPQLISSGTASTGHLGRRAADLPGDDGRPRGRQRRRGRRLLLDLRHPGAAGPQRRIHQVLRRPHRRRLPVPGAAAALQSRRRVPRRRQRRPRLAAGRHRGPARQDRQRQIDEVQEGLGQEERQVREEEGRRRRRRSERTSDRGAGPMAERARGTRNEDAHRDPLRLALSVLALAVAGVCGALLPGSRAGRQRNQTFRGVPDHRPGRRPPGHRDRSRVREPPQQPQRRLQLLRRPGGHRSPADRRDRQPVSDPDLLAGRVQPGRMPGRVSGRLRLAR